MGDSKFGEVVFAIDISAIEVEWLADEVEIDNAAVGRCMNAIASAHEKYLRTLCLSRNVCSVIHFRRAGSAAIEFHVSPSNMELDLGAHEVESIQSQIQESFQRHLSQVQKIVGSSNTELTVDDLGGEYASVEALAKCITKPINMEVTYRLNNGAQTERVEIAKMIVGDVTCSNDCVEIVAEVARFDDISGRVVLYKVRGMQGHVTLLVLDEPHRDALLDAQRKRGQVSVKYQPFISQIRPDKEPREGRLISVSDDSIQMRLT